jgi:hypothetical protein
MSVYQLRVQEIPERKWNPSEHGWKKPVADNIMIERWFRSFKYEEAYLTEWHNIKEARRAIG